MNGRKRTVLVVDDEQMMRDFLRVALTSLGYGVRVAADGDEGVRQFLAERPDCVVCDLYMPGKDGLEAIPEFRRLDASVPVAAISGGSSAFPVDLLPVAKTLGASAALRKPFSVGELKACLATLFAPQPPA